MNAVLPILGNLFAQLPLDLRDRIIDQVEMLLYTELERMKANDRMKSLPARISISGCLAGLRAFRTATNTPDEADENQGSPV